MADIDTQVLASLPPEARDPLPPLKSPRFKVTIERIEERHTVDRQWVELRSDTEQKLLRESIAAERPDMSLRDFEREIPAQRGYRPRVEVQTVTTEILRSEIETLDVRQVIAAIHGLPYYPPLVVDPTLTRAP